MKKNKKQDNNYKNIFIWISAAVFSLVVLAMFNMPSNPEVSYSQLIKYSKNNDIIEVSVYNNYVVAKLRNGTSAQVNVSILDTSLAKELDKNGANVVYINSNNSNLLYTILISWFPFLLLIGFAVFFATKMQGGGGPMSFGRSKAKSADVEDSEVTFDDVAGVDEAKEDVAEIVEFLSDPTRFEKIGGKIPKGVLLIGPPGTGKTLLAKAVAGEASVPFFSISGSDFVEMFVGVGASRVRDLFAQAKKSAPCLIFIDEIDAVGRHRGAGVGGGNDEREQTLNQLLVEMDGFAANAGVIIIAATNRPDVLDPALLRPGRFDRRVTVSLPLLEGRKAILKVHIKDVSLSNDIDILTIAQGTPGFSGADLANLVNEAALFAARSHKRKVSMIDFDKARDKIFMGPEKRSLVMKKEDLKRTAYHEAGHAIVQLKVGNVDSIYKATIVPRGYALGAVFSNPEDDRISLSRAKILGDIATAYGGRIAEEEFFGYDQVTTGASNDIMQATKNARNMVTEWGLSDLGPIMFEEQQGEVFLGHSVTQHKNISEQTANQIDAEMKKILDACYKTAKDIIAKHKDDLIKIAEALLVHETLTGEEIKNLLEGKEFKPQLKEEKKSEDKVIESVVSVALKNTNTFSDEKLEEIDTSSEKT